jgi:hypothetical protein
MQNWWAFLSTVRRMAWGEVAAIVERASAAGRIEFIDSNHRSTEERQLHHSPARARKAYRDSVGLPRQLRQPSDIDHDPPRLVLAVSRERRPIGVTDNILGRHLGGAR